MLSVFAVGNVPLEQALEQLRQLKDETRREGNPSPDHISRASKEVENAFRELERRASLEIHADKVWQLLRSGKGSDALHRIASLRDEISNNLNEVEALWNLVANVSAENELASTKFEKDEKMFYAEEAAYA